MSSLLFSRSLLTGVALWLANWGQRGDCLLSHDVARRQVACCSCSHWSLGHRDSRASEICTWDRRRRTWLRWTPPRSRQPAGWLPRSPICVRGSWWGICEGAKTVWLRWRDDAWCKRLPEQIACPVLAWESPAKVPAAPCTCRHRPIVCLLM